MIAIFPGSFDPPTHGHVQVVKKALFHFGSDLYIVCSSNPNKTDRWFTPEECVDMWCSYNIPFVNIVTFNQMRKKNVPNIIMIRGLRNTEDIHLESTVMYDAYRDFQIQHFHYILCPEVNLISSSYVKRLFKEGVDLNKFNYVSEEVIKKMEEHGR